MSRARTVAETAGEALDRAIGDAAALQRQQDTVGEDARFVHRALLRFFERHGRPPAAADDAEVAAQAGLRPDALAAALDQLVNADLVVCDERGEVLSAYPYSGRSTRHRVEFTDGGSVHAMCAVDALGIPLMTGRDATVVSSDPAGERSVRVVVRDGVAEWDPPEAGVFVARTAGAGSIAETCCEVTDFFASPEAARMYHEGRDTEGMWLDHAQALEAGRLAFASMLDGTGGGPACRC